MSFSEDEIVFLSSVCWWYARMQFETMSENRCSFRDSIRELIERIEQNKINKNSMELLCKILAEVKNDVLPEKFDAAIQKRSSAFQDSVISY